MLDGFPATLPHEHLFDMHADLDAPQLVGATPFGTRAIFYVTGGSCDGPRLRGGLLPGGGDWYLGRADGAGELDVRATIETDDGALVFAHYRGVLDASPAVFARITAGEDVPMSEYYFRTSPRFETGDARYAWLNKVVAVGVGRARAGSVEYRIFAIR